ncbi:MAG: SRPBCC family protein [Fuerstiella sp.]|nr:SRPBCC family protein [Fuerstiella sp.]
MIEITPTNAGTTILMAEQHFCGSVESVFDFFADAGNLEAITPPWLNFKIETPLPIDMHNGTLIDYRLRLRRIPIRWRTVISEWEPPFRFVDTQIRGPYRVWRHTHIFEETGDGTLMQDLVEYSVPGGYLINKLFVESDLKKIFGYRQQCLARKLSGPMPDVV